MNRTRIVSPQTSPNIERTDEPRQLTTGPTGIASRSLPDNRGFWPVVNAKTFRQRGSGRRNAYRAVAYYCSLSDERVCTAAVDTQAERADLSPKAMRRQLQGLLAEGAILAEGGVSRGGLPTRYRLPDDVYNPPVKGRPTLPSRPSNPPFKAVQPSLKGRVNPPLKGVNKGNIKSTKNTAALRAREVCNVCQYSWPAEYGKDCYLCLKAKAQAGPSAEDKRRARFEASKQKFLERTGGRSTDTRTAAINQERLARMRGERGGGD